MKKIIALILIAASFILCLAGCKESPSSMPEEMPEDFSFYVRWGYAGSYYDSASGELRKKSGEKFVTEYTMTEDELIEVYEIICELGIENYDDVLSPGNIQAADPCMTVILTVHAGGFDKTVKAEDVAGLNDGITKRGKAYLQAVVSIVNILQATEAWQALPPDTDLYY